MAKGLLPGTITYDDSGNVKKNKGTMTMDQYVAHSRKALKPQGKKKKK